MTVQNLDDLVDQVKVQNRIDQVIAETPGFSVTGHSRYLSTMGPDGHKIVIDTHNGAYHWHSRGEHGDVIRWVEMRNNWDFKSALEYLCKRAGLPEPQWGQGSPSQRLAARARQDVYEVAVGIFQAALWEDPIALAYPRQRGWSDETIQRARLGYTGNPTTASMIRQRLSDAIVSSGGDPLAPSAVSLLGYKGDVKQYAIDKNIEFVQDWLDDGKIPGVIGRNMLVYPHFFGAHCCYFSLRAVGQKAHYNLPVELAGARQGYPNYEWSPRETTCVVVEGQADAITLAQWGIPAYALCGTAADEHLARFLGAGDEQRDITIYVGVDDDAAGKKAAKKVLELFGPMARAISWNGVNGITSFIDQTKEGQPEAEVKDANDLLRGMLK